SSSASRAATGFRLYLSSGFPFGRPRCEARISRPPFSITYRMDGKAAVILVSSVIFPSASGTLKSTRMNTRLPERARSEIDSLFTEIRSFHDELDAVSQTDAEAPFVVVPREYFHHPITQSFRQRSIDDGRMRVVQEIRRDQFFVGVLENAFQRSVGSSLQCAVD